MTMQQDRSSSAPPKNDVPLTEHPFPVAGIGASAGGLDAFKSLLQALPDDTGMAFVLIQHLDPQHDSLMADLLAVHTKMPVTQAAEGDVIRPNRIYLIPPGVSLAIVNGKLHLSEPIEHHGARKAFDFFLRSLAEAQGSRSACVVLSGTGADGSEGLKALKKAGGFVVVQEPSEAAFDGMPKSAIQTGNADLVLPVAEIPEALIRHFGTSSARQSTAKPDTAGKSESTLVSILDLVQAKTGQDFALYKTGTLTRRIERRMSMAGVTDPEKYIAQLRADPAELDHLAEDLLINVTHFFRDTEAFDALAKTVIPELIRSQPSDVPVRVWTPGCSTGEEVYSLTMLFIEAIAASKRNLKLQVFASDVDTQAIAFARAGLYGPETAKQISSERLDRFFTKEGESYRVTRSLRETVVFTTQDLLADPPFSRLDFISCRNVLIYLRPDAQEQILSLFHFALRRDGVLFLGRSETVGKFSERFEPINKKQRIYRHVKESRPGEVDFGVRHKLGTPSLKTPTTHRPVHQRSNLEDLATKLVSRVFAPPSVLVDKKYEPLFYSGDVDRFLQVTSGEANRSILIMARQGLRPALRTALDTARDTKELAWKAGGKIKHDGVSISVRIGVQPVQDEGLFLVSFIEEASLPAAAAEGSPPPEDASRVYQLEQELSETRDELNAAIRDLELSNEELRAANEEALSTNEEFQSTNEELETSKEELQSLNEELTALNGQLHETLEQHRATATDLQNILNSSDVATLFLDRHLNIRFFTPAAKALFGAIGTDIGRPLTDLAQKFEDDALIGDAHAVLANAKPVRREIESHDGEWYNRSILPYRINDSHVEGVVVTFASISAMKAAERKIEAAKAFAEGVISTVKQPLAVLDKDLCLISASPSFFRAFGINPQDSTGKPFTLAGPREAEILTTVLAPAQRGEPIEDLELVIDLGALGERTLLLSAREIAGGNPPDQNILVSIDDVTEARKKTDALAVARDEAEHANRLKSNFLAAASHDLRQPLQTMNLLLGMLGDEAMAPSSLKLLSRIENTITSMSGLLDKLLDINQLEAGVVSPRPDDFEINDMLAQLSSEFGIHAANDGLALRFVPCHLTVRTDPRLLEQILRNMISNAIKYTGRGRILLGARRRGDRLRIEVWDTGTGIPDDKLASIFKEGHQLKNRVPRRARGLGLGLSIVQRLSDLLGLPVKVRSWVGHGSVFSVEVPIVDGPARIPAHYQKPASPRFQDKIPVARSAASSAILVVEDDAELRDALQLLLESQGLPAVAAADEREALAVAARGDPRIDFVIADYNLPGASGLEVMEKLEEALDRKLPGIFLTGDISAATLLEIAAKKYLHLYKPVEAAVLVSHVERARRAIQRKVKAEKILVVDDDSEFCEAMRDTLEMHGFEADIFTDASALLAVEDLTKARCVITDVHMPGMSGLELAAHLAEIAPSLPVIAVTGYGDVATAVEAMKSGAFDFLEKPVQPDELIERIERALHFAGQRHALVAEKETAAATMAKLTTRQREILDLVLKGAPSKIIAADLKISQRTVDNHRAAIMRKFGVRSIPSLVRIALAAHSD